MRKVRLDQGVVVEWERLAAEDPPFLRPAFFMATARWLAPPGDPVLVTAHQEGRLAAILPLLLHRGRLTALRSVHTPRFDLVGHRGALGAMWKRLRDDRRWHQLEVSGVPEGSALVGELSAMARGDGFLVAHRVSAAGPYFALDRFEEALPGDFRRKLAARRRKLGEVWFERVAQADEEALEDMFRLEAAAWKGRAGTAISSSPATVGFYTELARRFAAAGALTLGFLRAGEHRVAAHFAVEDGRTYYLLKTGYDPDHARFGPGQLLVYEAARDARARGLREFDFLGPVMDWKLAWTERTRRHVRVFVYRPTARGRASHAVRHVVRPAIGRIRRLAQAGRPRA